MSRRHLSQATHFLVDLFENFFWKLCFFELTLEFIELGIFIIVAAKVLGTAFVGRLFVLVEPQLMTFAWFARALNWWRETKAKIVERVRRSAPWRAARALRRLWLARARKAMR